MPTPVGPPPRDPNDPDLWDWGEDGDVVRPRRVLRTVVVVLIVLGLVLLVVASVV